jgi:putative FmdB family regulatory protein
MPVYTYECGDCGVRFDARQSFSDDPITVCPECEGRVHRLIQPAGIIFKGSGFYVTDNRGSRSSLTSSGKSESGNGEGKSETKAESKPEKSHARPDSPKPAKSDD